MNERWLTNSKWECITNTHASLSHLFPHLGNAASSPQRWVQRGCIKSLQVAHQDMPHTPSIGRISEQRLDVKLRWENSEPVLWDKEFEQEWVRSMELHHLNAPPQYLGDTSCTIRGGAGGHLGQHTLLWVLMTTGSNSQHRVGQTANTERQRHLHHSPTESPNWEKLNKFPHKRDHSNSQLKSHY
jgi:hypothetical protein